MDDAGMSLPFHDSSFDMTSASSESSQGSSLTCPMAHNPQARKTHLVETSQQSQYLALTCNDSDLEMSSASVQETTCCTAGALHHPTDFYWPDKNEVDQLQHHHTLGLSPSAFRKLLALFEWPSSYRRLDRDEYLVVECVDGEQPVELDDNEVKRVQIESTAGMRAAKMGVKRKCKLKERQLKEVTSSDHSSAIARSCCWSFEAPEHWVTEKFGEQARGKEVGYDLIAHVQCLFTQRDYSDFSAVEVFFGQEGVGEAKVFLSHVQSELVTTTLEAMEEKCGDTCIFVDYFCIRQLASNDFNLQEMETSISSKSYERTVLLLDPMLTSKEPNYTPEALKRIFCMFEIAVTIKNKKTLSGHLSVRGYLSLLPSEMIIDVERAECRNRHATQEIKTEYLVKLGYDAVNAMIEEEMKKTMADAKKEAVWRLFRWVLLCNTVMSSLGALASLWLPSMESSGHPKYELNPLAFITYEMVLSLLQLLETKEQQHSVCSIARSSVQLKAGGCQLALAGVCVLGLKFIGFGALVHNLLYQFASGSLIVFIFLICPVVGVCQWLIRQGLEKQRKKTDQGPYLFSCVAMTLVDLQAMAIFRGLLAVVSFVQDAQNCLSSRRPLTSLFILLLLVVVNLPLLMLAICPGRQTKVVMKCYVLGIFLSWFLPRGVQWFLPL